MNNTVCPMCGQPLGKRSGNLRRAFSAYGRWRSRRITRLDSSAVGPWQPPGMRPGPDETAPAGGYVQASRVTPVRPQNLESDFLTPLMQAIGTGFFTGLVSGLIAWQSPTFTYVFALGCGVSAAGLHWALAIIWNRGNLQVIESVVRQDLDGDGHIGPPPPPPAVALSVVHTSSDDPSFRRIFNFDLPAGITENNFRDFAGGVTEARRGLAEATWCGSGKPFSKPKYNDLMDTLSRAGIVRWRNEQAPAQGRELTPAGGRALRAWLRIARTHPHAANGDSGYVPVEGIG